MFAYWFDKVDEDGDLLIDFGPDHFGGEKQWVFCGDHFFKLEKICILKVDNTEGTNNMTERQDDETCGSKRKKEEGEGEGEGEGKSKEDSKKS